MIDKNKTKGKSCMKSKKRTLLAIMLGGLALLAAGPIGIAMFATSQTGLAGLIIMGAIGLRGLSIFSKAAGSFFQIIKKERLDKKNAKQAVVQEEPSRQDFLSRTTTEEEKEFEESLQQYTSSKKHKKAKRQNAPNINPEPMI